MNLHSFPSFSSQDALTTKLVKKNSTDMVNAMSKVLAQIKRKESNEENGIDGRY